MINVENLFISTNSSIAEAMRIIDATGLKTALIIGKNKKLLGILTDGDIRRGLLNGISIDDCVITIMNKNPIVIISGEDYYLKLNIARKKKLVGIPVITKEGYVQDFLVLDEINNFTSLGKKTISHLKKILVIGGAGYIGSVLVRLLLDKGYEVSVLDNFVYSQDSLDKVAGNITLIKGDTRNIEDVTEAIKDVDGVVHLAELVGDSACSYDPFAAQQINYLATKMVAQICKHFQINRFIYTSSCSVYGKSEKDIPLNEQSDLNPVSLYARMKIASEKALLESKDDNFKPTILRLSTVFGNSFRPRFDLVLNIFAAKAFHKENIEVFGGDQWRPSIHVTDVAKSIISILEAPLDQVGGKIFNVGFEENNCTIKQMSEIIKEIFPDVNIILKESAKDTRSYKVDFTKFKSINKMSFYTIKEGVEEMKKYLKDNPNLDYSDPKYNNSVFLEKNRKANFSPERTFN